ncbi:MAG: hypothetical protein HYV09_38490 [Deltaproteobacteria bacterium]|nr:hypothetical protein [Deltaproteobacteria bacterium]
MLSFELDLRQELSRTGGMTGEQTVFPAVERWLAEDRDHYRAFEILKARKSTRRYRSLMDFLLCEVCPSEWPACNACYRDRGPQLRVLRTTRQIRLLESKLLLFLTVAYEAYCQKRALSWKQAVEMVDEVCRCAA